MVRNLLITVLTIATAVSADAEVLTLDQALGMALEANYLVQVARNNQEMSENNAGIGNAGLLPKVDLTGGVSYQDLTPAGSGSAATTQSNAQVKASYTLFDGLGSLYRLKKLQTERDLGRLDSRDQIENVLLSVSQAYFQAASSAEQLNIARELLAISNERFIRTQERSRFGQAQTVDVLAAQVDFNNDSVTVAQARLSWEESRRNLNALLNRDLSYPFQVDTQVLFVDMPSLEDLKQTALENNASYLASVQAEKQSKLNWRITQSSQIPRVDLTGSYGYSQLADDFHIGLDDPSKTWAVGASLSFNLFNGFQNRIQSQNARLSYNNQTLRKDQTLLDLENLTTNAYEAYKNTQLILNLEQKNLEAAQLNFDRTQDLYQLGQVTSTQFREAQLNLIRAKSNISDAKYNVKLNEMDLLKIGGRLMNVAPENEL